MLGGAVVLNEIVKFSQPLAYDFSFDQITIEMNYSMVLFYGRGISSFHNCAGLYQTREIHSSDSIMISRMNEKSSLIRANTKSDLLGSLR